MKREAKICLALDVDSLEDVSFLIRELKNPISIFKVGLQLYCKFGNKIVEKIKKAGVEVFLDLKFLDIPNTVANACRVVTNLGVDIINIHAIGGMEMMKAARDAVHEEANKNGIRPPKLIGVTVLTSIDKMILNKEMRISGGVNKQVLHLAQLAQEATLDGVVASPLETKLIRKVCGEEFLIVTPGIRPAFSLKEDQKRIMTPSRAVMAGTNVLVIGRPIYASPNPRQAVEEIVKEISS